MIAGLVAATLAEFALYAHLTSAATDRAPWDAGLPAHIVPVRHAWPVAMRAVFLVLAGIQSYLLFRLTRTEWQKPAVVGVAVACAAALLSVAAVRAPYLTSNDAYAYIGYAKLPATDRPYAPPASNLPAPFGVIDDIWTGPLLPVYGPLDLAIYRAAAGPQPTLDRALLAVRLVGLGSLVVCAVLVFALTRNAALVALVMLNPGLYEQTVVNAHNDLIAVDLILCGVLIGRRSAVAGAVVAACSGFIKINFALIAPTFAPPRLTLAKRLAAVAGIWALIVAGSALFGGELYWKALTYVGQQYGSHDGSRRDLLLLGTHAGIALFAIVALVLAAIGARAPWSFAWSFVGLGVAIYAGYLVWSIPYVLRERKLARAYLAILPIPSLTLDFVFPGSGECTLLVILIAMSYEAVQLARRRGALYMSSSAG